VYDYVTIIIFKALFHNQFLRGFIQNLTKPIQNLVKSDPKPHKSYSSQLINTKMSSETLPLVDIDQCRICLDDDKPLNMIYPCQCAGTNKYVHDHCIKQWIFLSDNPEFKTKCPTCHYTYTMESYDFNENAINCNGVYRFLSVNFWKVVVINQFVLIFTSLLIGTIDINNSGANNALYNATQPVVSSITEFQNSPFFVYYSFTCLLYTVMWLLIIVTNILLLRNSTLLYIKKIHPLTILITPIALILAIYVNMISFVIGTFILTRLVQLWVKHHLHTLELIKSVYGLQIENYNPA